MAYWGSGSSSRISSSIRWTSGWRSGTSRRIQSSISSWLSEGSGGLRVEAPLRPLSIVLPPGPPASGRPTVPGQRPAPGRSGWGRAVPGVAEGPLGEGQDLGRLDRPDLGGAADRVPEAVVVHGELPAAVPLVPPRLGQRHEGAPIGDPLGPALDDHVEPAAPVVAPGGDGDVRVGREVHGLLLVWAGAEVQAPGVPHGDERGDVGAAVAADRRQPGELGLLQDLAGGVPRGGRRSWVAEALVELGDDVVHWSSFDIPAAGASPLGTSPSPSVH